MKAAFVILLLGLIVVSQVESLTSGGLQMWGKRGLQVRLFSINLSEMLAFTINREILAVQYYWLLLSQMNMFLFIVFIVVEKVKSNDVIGLDKNMMNFKIVLE